MYHLWLKDVAFTLCSWYMMELSAKKQKSFIKVLKSSHSCSVEIRGTRWLVASEKKRSESYSFAASVHFEYLQFNIVTISKPCRLWLSNGRTVGAIACQSHSHGAGYLFEVPHFMFFTSAIPSSICARSLRLKNECRDSPSEMMISLLKSPQISQGTSDEVSIKQRLYSLGFIKRWLDLFFSKKLYLLRGRGRISFRPEEHLRNTWVRLHQTGSLERNWRDWRWWCPIT